MSEPLKFPIEPFVKTLQHTLDDFYARCRELGYSEAEIDKMVTDCAVQSGGSIENGSAESAK